jgi:HEAT repeat protein
LTSRIQELIRDLDSDVEDVRKAAVVWLSQLHDPSTLPHLARHADDPSPAVRYFARKAVDELKVRPALEAAPPEPAAIAQFLQSPDRGQRIMAAMACYAIREPRLLPHLLKALEGETDLHVIATLVKAVGAQRDPKVIPQLVHLLHHTDSRVRSNTVDAAMMLDDAEVLDAVSVLASDANGRVRSSVALYLANRDPSRVPQMVREMIDSDLVWMKDSAVYVMHAIGAPWCVPLLEDLSKRPNEHPALLRKISVALSHLKQKLGGEEANEVNLSGSMVNADPNLIAQVRAEAEAALAAEAAARAKEQAESKPGDEAHRLMLVRLGTQAFKSSRIGELPEQELAAQAEKVAALGATLDRGQRLQQTLAQRDVELAELGRLVIEAARKGQLENEALKREALKAIGAMDKKPEEPAPTAEESAEEAPAEQPVQGSRGIKAPQRETGKAVKPSKTVLAPELPQGTWFQRNKLLVLPAGILVLVIGGVGIGTFVKSDSVLQKFVPPIIRKERKPEDVLFTIQQVCDAPDRRVYKGKAVRWLGKVKDGAGTMRLSLTSGKYEFVVEYDKVLEADLVDGMEAFVDGFIEGATATSVTLKGIRLRARPMSSVEREKLRRVQEKQRR